MASKRTTNNGLSNAKKKEWAKLLFTKEHLPQNEIAERVGVTPQTVSRWVKSENWELLQASLTVTREEQLAALYRQVAEMNKSIAEREEGQRYPNTKEADILAKLASSIEKMERETGIGEVITSLGQFLNFLRRVDLDQAQKFIPLMDDFVQSKLNG